jgi:hypothetical protein
MEATMTTQISKLQRMGLKELREKYREVFGKPTKSRNAKQLFAQIARRMQEGEPKGPTVTAKFERKRKTRSRRVAKPKAKKGTRSKRQHREPGQRDPRLPKPGTTITREYKGKKLLVRVLDEGFEYRGKPYRSLSALAKQITGQIVNGFAWFKVGLPSKETKKS